MNISWQLVLNSPYYARKRTKTLVQNVPFSGENVLPIMIFIVAIKILFKKFDPAAAVWVYDSLSMPMSMLIIAGLYRRHIGVTSVESIDNCRIL